MAHPLFERFFIATKHDIVNKQYHCAASCYVVPFHPCNKQQPYGCVCVRECISLCLTNGVVCERYIANCVCHSVIVFGTLCAWHLPLYSFSRQNYRSTVVCVCIYATTMEPIQFWLPVGFFMFCYCLLFFHVSFTCMFSLKFTWAWEY